MLYHFSWAFLFQCCFWAFFSLFFSFGFSAKKLLTSFLLYIALFALSLHQTLGFLVLSFSSRCSLLLPHLLFLHLCVSQTLSSATNHYITLDCLNVEYQVRFIIMYSEYREFYQLMSNIPIIYISADIMQIIILSFSFTGFYFCFALI